MQIGALSSKAGVNIQTVRYYERIGLLAPPQRRESGYRVYDADALKRLLFIRRAQELGFSLDDIRELLSLSAKSAAGRLRARARAEARLADIRSKITDLKRLESNLKKLVGDCRRGANTGPCPILAAMGDKS